MNTCIYMYMPIHLRVIMRVRVRIDCYQPVCLCEHVHAHIACFAFALRTLF